MVAFELVAVDAVVGCVSLSPMLWFFPIAVMFCSSRVHGRDDLGDEQAQGKGLCCASTCYRVKGFERQCGAVHASEKPLPAVLSDGVGTICSQLSVARTVFL